MMRGGGGGVNGDDCLMLHSDGSVYDATSFDIWSDNGNGRLQFSSNFLLFSISFLPSFFLVFSRSLRANRCRWQAAGRTENAVAVADAVVSVYGSASPVAGVAGRCFGAKRVAVSEGGIIINSAQSGTVEFCTCRPGHLLRASAGRERGD